MVQKVEGEYYEMGLRLLAGIVVDKELKDKLEVVFKEAKEKISDLILDNPQHVKETESSTCYPLGKQTDFNYTGPKGILSQNVPQRLRLLQVAFSMKKVEHLYDTDIRNIDIIKCKVQRSIEDEQLAENGGEK